MNVPPSKNSSLFGPEPVTEIVLTWYQGTPTEPGPINFQFYGFKGHQVPLEEVLQILEKVYQKLAQEYVRTHPQPPEEPVHV